MQTPATYFGNTSILPKDLNLRTFAIFRNVLVFFPYSFYNVADSLNNKKLLRKNPANIDILVPIIGKNYPCVPFTVL